MHVHLGLSAVAMGADTKANILGGGALEHGDLRLLEDGGECSGALVSDFVASETASEGHEDGNGENVGMSTGADRKANTLGRGALERGHGAPFEPLAQLGDSLRGVGTQA